MRGPTEEQRAEARRAYESGESMASIAKRLQLNRTTLIKIRDTEQWVVQAPIQVSNVDAQAMRADAQRKVIDMATRQVVQQAVDSGAVAAEASFLGLALAMQNELAHELQQYALEIIKRARAQQIAPGDRQNEADVASSAITAASKAIAAARDIGGLKAGQISFDGGPKVDTSISVNVRRLPMTRDDYDKAKSA